MVSKKFMTRYNTVIFGGTSGFGKHLVDLIEKESNSKYLYLESINLLRFQKIFTFTNVIWSSPIYQKL